MWRLGLYSSALLVWMKTTDEDLPVKNVGQRGTPEAQRLSQCSGLPGQASWIAAGRRYWAERHTKAGSEDCGCAVYETPRPAMHRCVCAVDVLGCVYAEVVASGCRLAH